MTNTEDVSSERKGGLVKIVNGFTALFLSLMVFELFRLGETELAILFTFGGLWYLIVLHYLGSMATGGVGP